MEYKFEAIAGCLDYARNAIVGPNTLVPRVIDKLTEASPQTLEEFLDIARQSDLILAAREMDKEELAHVGKPIVALLENGNAILVVGPASDKPGEVMILDPLDPKGKITSVSYSLVEDKYSGMVVDYTVKLPNPLLRNFAALAKHHGVDVTVESLAHEYAVDDDLTMAKLARIGKDIGFKVSKKKISLEKLAPHYQLFPVIAMMKESPIVIRGIGVEQRKIDTIDISHVPPLEREYTFEEFEAETTGEVILVKRHFKISDTDQPFGLRWFIPEFLRHKRIFRDVIIAAVLLQIVALAMPLFFQVVVDKVLVHRSVTTLTVLGAGILLAIGFETAFSYARGFILLYGVNKIDVRVATATFKKLASLPVAFFDSTRSGILIKHMQQAEKIRSFLSGRVLFSALDGFSLCVFLPVLFFYSPLLCGIVLAFSLAMALVIMAIIPTFRRRLYELYEADGQRQSFLVETIQGMNTVKSLSLESRRGKEWDNRVAQAINMNFKVGRLSIAATTITGLLEKVMLVLVIWVGVYMVFDNTLTIGSLIAFQMISSRVSSPLVQIVSLIHEYQETALSVKMLGSIMNQESEYSITQRGMTPGIRGAVTFSNVTFSYAPSLPPALENLSFTVPPGTVLGIAGRSGSGKSTISRLVQGLYKTRNGSVKIDGFDINDLELPHLRQSIGVVLQDDFIFHGTVRENIQAANPTASFEKVVHCAKLAGADEFIQRLPKGFDTLLEENGANLSGGQKQRLAIARALLSDPKILILDEATSALDAESERIVNDNLRKIARGRTLLVISHRLSMIAAADSIIVLDGGHVVGNAPHDRLVNECKLYRTLWETQTQFATKA